MPPPADSTPRGATRGVPMVLVTIAVLLLAARIGIGLVERGKPQETTQGKVRWQTIEAGEAMAQKTGKPILYDFTAEWCGPCRQLEREVFANTRSARFIEHYFVPIRVTDRQREDGRNPPDVARLQSRHQVQAFPTLVVVRGDSTMVRIEGYPGATDVIGRLTSATIYLN